MIVDAKYVIQDYGATQFMFKLVAPNGQTIAVSEGYTTKQSCKDGINSVRTYASTYSVEDNATHY
jgi:uncharacterized protein YegP (UPF0339 family)